MADIKSVIVDDPFGVIKFVHMTEKSIQLVEKENKLVFIVKRDANKDEIKNAVKNIFKQDVKDVKVLIDQKGRKKAFVKFSKEDAAGEIALQLGVI
jgi:large subunit ribosomal protein L23